MNSNQNVAENFSAPPTDAEKEQSAYVRSHYTKYEFQIPVTDGAKLFTIVYAPKDSTHPWPIMMKRTPYGIPPYGIDSFPTSVGPTDLFAKEGFIFVYQDTRGRGMSEGTFEDIPPQNVVPNDATDTADTIEWLVDNIPNHNGKVGMWGSSYNGFTAGCSLIDSHPALKAVSPQAPTAEQGKGDDAYHNGCFCLAAEFNFYATFTPRAGGPAPVAGWPPGFDYGTPDMYEFFLRLGPISNANSRYFKNANRYWNALLDHPNYDQWWQDRSLSRYMDRVKPAVLVVGGWFDAQDLTGPFALFNAIEAREPAASNTLVIGPWQHSGWYWDAGDTLGNLSFNLKTGEYYREHIELAFFKRHLKGEDGPEFPKAIVFETGRNQWRRLPAWPPAGVERRLYLGEGGQLSFKATGAEGADEYVSDPARPVPVLPEFNVNPPFNYFMTEDQRFASKRPDVLVYETGELKQDFVIAGEVEAVLTVSTSGTDSDFVVKLIDVYPNDYPDTEATPAKPVVVRRGGYQQLVRGEPFRGKFRNSTLENPEPEPFKPGDKAVIRFRMPAVFHAFRRGHRIMIHIQSSWFPLVDRNPQTFCDIPKAQPKHFVKANQKIHRGGADGSHIIVNAIEDVQESDEKTKMKWNTIKPGVLTVWTYSGFAPVCFVKDGEPVGMDISFLKKFVKEVGADHGVTTVEFVARCEFDGIWFMPGKERCDIAAAGISPWQWRKDESPGVVWTDDYFHVQRSLLIRKTDAKKFHTIADFENKTIAVTIGSSADTDVRARKPESTKIVPITDQKVAVKDLLEGRIDAIAEGDVSNQYLAKDQPLILIDEHELDPDNPEAFSFPVRQASGILDALNAWIAARAKDEYLNIEI